MTRWQRRAKHKLCVAMREVSWCSRCKSRNQIKNRFRCLAVEVPRRLIGQQQLRPSDERPGQSHPLLLSAGKFAGTMMRPLLQSDLTQPAQSFWLDLLPGLPSHQQRHGNIFQRREFRQQIVKLPDKADFAVAKFCGFVLRTTNSSRKLAQYTSPAEALSRAPRMCNKVLFPHPIRPQSRASLLASPQTTDSQRAPGPIRRTGKPSSGPPREALNPRSLDA